MNDTNSNIHNQNANHSMHEKGEIENEIPKKTQNEIPINAEEEHNKEKNITDDLKEGKLYKLENGELIELVIDQEELRKIKITDDAVQAATEVQKKMRTVLNGFKPDITTVCSALIKAQAEKPDATKVVANFWLQKAQMASSILESEG